MLEVKEVITDISKYSDRADEVDTIKGMKEARGIISEIKNTMRKNELTSLSAPEIGYDKRIFCIKFSDSEIKTFINPIISNASKEMVLSIESSSCLPGKRFLMVRNNDVEIMYTTPTNKIESRKISGMASAVFQMEINILDGVLLTDVGFEIDELWDNATQEEREEVINKYLDELDLLEKKLASDINNDEDIKRVADAIEFNTAVKTGKVEIEGIEEKEDAKERERLEAEKKEEE